LKLNHLFNAVELETLDIFSFLEWDAKESWVCDLCSGHW